MLSAMLGDNLARSFGVASLEEQTPEERAYAPLPQPNGTLIQDPDFVLPTIAGPLPWRLFHYSDRPDVESPFGYGRRASWPSRLCVDNTPGSRMTVMLEREDGHSVRYYRSAPDHPFTTLSQRVFDRFTLTYDGSNYYADETRFDTGAVFRYPVTNLASIAYYQTSLTYYQTVQGQRVTFGYDADKRLSTIQEPTGRNIQYSYNADGFVKNVQDWAQRVHTFTYTPSDEMETMQGPAGEVTTYQYDSDHRLSKIIDPDGFETEYTYDDDGRVLTRTLDGDVQRYTYPSAGVVAYTDALSKVWTTTLDQYGNVTATIDPVGATRNAQYNSSGLPKTVVDAIGRITTMDYDTNGRETLWQDPTGARWERTYDAYGNRLTERDPMDRRMTFVYEGAGVNQGKTRQMQSQEDGVGAVTTYTYTSWGGLRTIKSPLGFVTTYNWTSQGVLEAEQNANGGIRTYNYDAAGNLIREFDESNYQTSYTYDGAGRRTSLANIGGVGAVYETLYTPRGNVRAEVDPLGYRTTYAYNVYGSVTMMWDANGQIWQTGYDAKGREISRTDPLNHTTQSIYDAADRRIAEVDALGRRTTTNYDLARQAISILSSANLLSATEYDRAGRVIAEITPDGIRYTTTYNAAGQIETTIEPAGLRYTTLYDGAGQSKSFATPSGAMTTINYDRDGRAIEQIDLLGRIVTSQYDNIGQLNLSIDPMGRRHTMSYAPNGFLQEEQSWDGVTITRFQDPLGRLGQASEASEDPNDNTGYYYYIYYDLANQITQYQDGFDTQYYEYYTPTGQLKALTDDVGNRFTYTYNDGRFLARTEDTLGNKSTFEYDDTNTLSRTYDEPNFTNLTEYFPDPFGRLETVKDAWGYATTIAYHPVSGRVAAFVDERAARTTFIHDAFGRFNATLDTRNNLTTINYDTAGRAVGFTDPLGFISTMVYDVLNRPTEAIDPLGYRTTVTYGLMGASEASRFLQQTDPLGYITTQLYDARGNLWVSIDALSRRATYSYDATSRQIRYQDARGFIFTTNYEPYKNRIRSTINPRGFRTTYIYDPGEVDRLVAMQDARGFRTSNIYDSKGRLTAIQDALGYRRTTVYDTYDRAVATVDALGFRTTNIYDKFNRIEAIQNAKNELVTNIYDSTGNLQAVVNALGQRTTNTYDDEGNLTSQTDARGYTTYYSYTPRNERAAMLDPLGFVTAYRYDPVGRPIEVLDALGFRTTTVYDGRGQAIAQIDALGYRRSTTYDPVGRVWEQVNELSRRTTNLYDEIGLLRAAIRPDNTRITSTYDSVGNLSSQMSARGYVTSYTYNGTNQVVEVLDPLNYRHTTVYDALGQVRAEVAPPSFRTTYSYDGRGLRIEVQNALGFRTTTLYDALQRQEAIWDAQGRRTTTVYDRAGRMIASVNALGTRISHDYDPVGNKIADINGLGFRTTYTYDALSRPTGKQDPLGRRVTMAYDAVGQIRTLTDARGQMTTYTYNARREEIERVYADGSRLTFTYDPVGNRTLVVDPTGRYTATYDVMERLATFNAPSHTNGFPLSYAYDASGNRAVLQMGTDASLNYTYDALEQMLTVRDSNVTGATGTVPGGTTTYSYDSRGLLFRQDNPDGSRTTTTYDAVGRPIQKRHSTSTGTEIERAFVSYDSVGRPLWKDTLSGRYTYGYDPLGQLTSENAPISGLTTWTYDPAFRRTVQLRGASITSYNYDAADQLTWQQTGADYTTYSYDANGSRTEVVTASGQRTTTTWDAANRLATMSLPNGNRFAQTYRYDDLRVREATPTRTDQYVWDGHNVFRRTGGGSGGSISEWWTRGATLVRVRGRLDTVVEGEPVLSTINTQFHLDNQGSVQVGTGGVVRTDAWGNVLSGGSEGAVYLGGLGYWYEPDMGLYYVRQRWMDAATGRWLSADADWDELPFGYVANMPTTHTDPSGNQGRPNVTDEPPAALADKLNKNLTQAQLRILYPQTATDADAYVRKYYPVLNESARAQAERFIRSIHQKMPGVAKDAEGYPLNQYRYVAPHNLRITAALSRQFGNRLHVFSKSEFQAADPLGWAVHAPPHVIKKAFYDSFEWAASNVRSFVQTQVKAAARGFVVDLLDAMKDSPWVNQWVTEIYQSGLALTSPLVQNLMPPTLADIPDYIDGLFKGMGEGLYDAIIGLNPYEMVKQLTAIAGQIAKVVNWLFAPNTKAFRPLLDMVKSLLNFGTQILDKQRFPVIARGELMGQILTAIVIALLAKKVAKIAPKLKPSGKVPTATTYNKNLDGFKAIDGKVDGLPDGSVEKLTDKRQALGKAFEKAVNRVRAYNVGPNPGKTSPDLNPFHVDARLKEGFIEKASDRRKIEKAYDRLSIKGTKPPLGWAERTQYDPVKKTNQSSGSYNNQFEREFEDPSEGAGRILVGKDIYTQPQYRKHHSLAASLAHELGEYGIRGQRHGERGRNNWFDEARASAWAIMNVEGLSASDKRLLAKHVFAAMRNREGERGRLLPSLGLGLDAEDITHVLNTYKVLGKKQGFGSDIKRWLTPVDVDD